MNLLIRFLVHFLFIEHDHKYVSLYDGRDQVFKVLGNQTKMQNNNSAIAINIK